VKSGRNREDLAAALRGGGFTPGQRDLDGVIDCLADPDEGVEREAERAIARLGAEVLPRLHLRASDPEPRIRAGIYRTLGRMAPKGEAEASWIVAGLNDADRRVRRHAAAALGKLRESSAVVLIESALLEAWDHDPSPDLERAIAASLGKLGSKKALPRLRAAEEKDAATSRIAQRATLTITRDLAREGESAIDPDRVAPSPVRVALRCREGLERIVADEAREWLNSIDPPRRFSGRVVGTFKGKLGELLRIRTMDSFAFVLPRVPLGKGPDEALAAALGSELARGLLETWTRGVVRFRIAWAGKGHHRASTWSAAHRLALLRPTWVNDPTESTLEVFAREVKAESGGVLEVELHPRGLIDSRFAYRVRDVPAASHPELAAALVRVAETRPDDWVWDPFMGSGVELVERSLKGPYGRLQGSDNEPRALEAARANFAAAGLLSVRVELADATSYVPERATLILTNPPMGRRVARAGSIGPLMDRFVDHAARVLVPGSRLVWLSPLGLRTATRARARGLELELDEEVDMGGFRASLQRIVRRCA
jgi:precorrin-6B methylase 2